MSERGGVSREENERRGVGGRPGRRRATVVLQGGAEAGKEKTKKYFDSRAERRADATPPRGVVKKM